MKIIATLLAFALLALGIGFVTNARSGGPLPTFLQRPAFEGWRKTAENTFSSENATMKLSLKANQLKQVSVRFQGIPSERAGKLLAALTGFTDIATQYAQYVTQTRINLEQPGGKTETVGTYRLNSQIRDGNLEFDVRVPEVPKESFVPVANVLGQKEANVVVRVFSDFECPYCEQFDKEVMNTWAKKLPAGVRLEFHHFPLESIHPRARGAAEASECAADQGQFWAFHDALFANRNWTKQANIGQHFLTVAKTLGLNTQKFAQCVNTHQFKTRVDAGLLAGQRVGVNGTPSVFVNGFKLENPYDPALIERMIAFARD